MTGRDDGTVITEPSENGPSRRPSLLLGGAHLAALWALAVAQPMLSLLGKNPDFFVARGNTTGQILIYAFTLTLGPPLVALALEALFRLVSRNAQWILHLVLMTLAGGLLVLHLIKDPLGSWPAGAVISLSLLLAAAGVFTYTRWRFPRYFMDILTISPLLILVVFLFFSPSSKLILPRERPEPVNVAVTRPAPVVMIILDELPLSSLERPDGRIDPGRYPALAELAGSSTWYRNATATAAYTPMAVPALLSGKIPSHSDLPVAADYPRSIFTLLGGSYRMNVMEDATRLCPEELCPQEQSSLHGTLGSLFDDLFVVSQYLQLPDSMTGNLPDITTTFANFGETDPEQPIVLPGQAASGSPASGQAQNTTGLGDVRSLGRRLAGDTSLDPGARIAEFNRHLTRGQQRTLNLIHIELPHIPWRYLPTGQRYQLVPKEWSGILPDNSVWRAPQHAVDMPLQRYLLQTGYADLLVGRVIARLKRTGLWDRSLVVVAADHGAAFQAHVERRKAVRANLGAIAPIPLLVKAPGQEKGRIVTTRTCATDLLPTIAAELGISYPWTRPNCRQDLVRVLNSPEGSSSATPAVVEQQRRALVGRISHLFGNGGWSGVYGFGPHHRQLIGRQIPLPGPDQLPGRSAAIPERRNQIRHFDPSSPLLRGLVQRGTTRGIHTGQLLAVAVNGRIAALGRTFRIDTDPIPRYSILLPPDSLRKGYNRADIYLVGRDGRSLELAYNDGR